jgi:hypothetical protein
MFGKVFELIDEAQLIDLIETRILTVLIGAEPKVNVNRSSTVVDFEYTKIEENDDTNVKLLQQSVVVNVLYCREILNGIELNLKSEV